MQIDCVSSEEHDPHQPTYCQFDDQPITVKAEYEPESNIFRCTVPEGSSSLRHRLISGDRPCSAVQESEERVTKPAAPEITSDVAHENTAKHSPPEAAEAKSKRGLGPFAVMSIAYILFTTTDGGVRVIVLLHAYQQGFSAIALASIFSGYELAGMVVNLLAGLAGSRWGFKATLLGGLTFQLCSLAMLMGWQDGWNTLEAIIYITFSQILNGIAKDLVKLGGKSVSKLVTAEEKQLKLFKLVAYVTGFKNSFKGVGYLLGAALLTANYYSAIAVMLVLVIAALPLGILGLDWQIGRTQKRVIKLQEVFQANYNVRALSLARFFLFASRDLWFEVTLPYFLRSTASGIGWSRFLVGAYLAIWIIIYGQVQSWSPKWILRPLGQSPPNKWAAMLWAALLVVCPAIMAGVLLGSDVYGTQADKPVAIVVITVVLYLFCLIFAVNSAVHSYLVVRYAEGNKVAMSVGFYYMANAGGRLVGTLLSGFLYTYVGDSIVTGFGACFVASVVFVLLSCILAFPIRDDVGGLSCGPCLHFLRPSVPTTTTT